MSCLISTLYIQFELEYFKFVEYNWVKNPLRNYRYWLILLVHFFLVLPVLNQDDAEIPSGNSQFEYTKCDLYNL